MAEAQQLAAELDPDVPVGGERRRRVRLRRTRARVLRRASDARAGRRRWRCCCTRRRCISTRRARAATARRRPNRCRPRWRRSSASSARRAQIAGMGRGAGRRRACPTRIRAEAADAAVQARQEHARVEGAGGGVRCRARRIRSTCSPPAARFRRRTTTTSTASWPRRFRRAWRFPTGARCRRVPDLPLADVRAFSIDDATTTEIDDAFSVRELAERQHRDRHPHRVPGAGDPARQRRSTRSRASGCRPSTCPAAS